MWQTKCALAVPKNLGLGLDFWPCSEDIRSPCPIQLEEIINSNVKNALVQVILNDSDANCQLNQVQ